MKIFMLQEILAASRTVFSGVSEAVQGCTTHSLGQRFSPPMTPDQKCSSFF